MRFYLLSGLLALASSAFADVTYNVIGFPDAPTNTFAVEINKKVYPLTTSESTFPIWSGKVVGASASSGYRFLQLDNKQATVAREKFLRVFSNKKAPANPNEFFNRQTTFTTLPTIKQIYKDIRPTPSKAFDSTQIGTIHLTADPAVFKDMIDNPMDLERKAIKAGFKFINADTVYAVEEVKVKVSGHGSRKFEKLSLRIKFDDEKGETFFDRPIIKLRNQVFDPTMIREKLYIDLLNSVGVTSYQGAYVRVYVNGKPHGFYLMVDDIEPEFLSYAVHYGAITKKKELGSLYQMGSHVLGLEATMQYNGSSSADYHPEIYENKNLGQNPKDEPMEQLIAFMKDLQDWNPSSSNAASYWSSRLDMDAYLRSMALEYLTGHWDAYWWKGNNYFMYYNVQTKVWQFIPTDFDTTFSDGNLDDVNVGYKDFARRRLARKGKDHPLITKLLYKNKDINALFEKVLLTITTGLFNNAALDNRINAYETQIAQDVEWDYKIDRSKQPGKNFGWTITDFHNSIKGPVKSVSFGIKPWIANRAKSVPNQVARK